MFSNNKKSLNPRLMPNQPIHPLKSTSFGTVQWSEMIWLILHMRILMKQYDLKYHKNVFQNIFENLKPGWGHFLETISDSALVISPSASRLITDRSSLVRIIKLNLGLPTGNMHKHIHRGGSGVSDGQVPPPQAADTTDNLHVLMLDHMECFKSFNSQEDDAPSNQRALFWNTFRIRFL